MEIIMWTETSMQDTHNGACSSDDASKRHSSHALVITRPPCQQVLHDTNRILGHADHVPADTPCFIPGAEFLVLGIGRQNPSSVTSYSLLNSGFQPVLLGECNARVVLLRFVGMYDPSGAPRFPH